jgi:ribonuclease-3
MAAPQASSGHSLEELEERLGLSFKDKSLLTLALTHRSYGLHHNERLEYLGDSVLNLAVAALLYKELDGFSEGDLSRVRSNLVRQQALHDIAQTLSLHRHLYLGDGERKSGGLRRPSILADTLEAIIAGVFLDQGYEAAYAVVERLYRPILNQVDPKTLGKDAKTLLQEFLQGNGLPLPVYAVVATRGAAHNQVFEVECSIPKLGLMLLGSGASRRAAEQMAATEALVSAQQALSSAPKKRRKTRSKDKAETPPQAKLSFEPSHS